MTALAASLVSVSASWCGISVWWSSMAVEGKSDENLNAGTTFQWVTK